MDNEIINFFSELMLRHAGIVIGKNKAYLIKSRIEEVSKSLGFDNIEKFYNRIKTNLDKEYLSHIIDALTTNETFFFRDRAQFDILKRYIIPELIKKKKAEKKLRIWSAACSTGQEPYSLLLLIFEYFPQLLVWDLEVIASDISRKVIEYAKKGEFSQIEVNRGLPASMLVKYFRQVGEKWIIDERIKKRIRFFNINLADNFSYLGRFDIIFCRYVLIYLNKELRKQILNKMEKMLNPGGYLFLGSTETYSCISNSLIRRSIDGVIFYQTRS